MMATRSSPAMSSTFSDLTQFTLGNNSADTSSRPAPIATVSSEPDEDEPVLSQLDGLRSLSVSEESPAAVRKDADDVTPPHSPQVAVVHAKRARGSDFDEDTLGKIGRTAALDTATITPPKAPSTSFRTPDGIECKPAAVFVTPPTPPRFPSATSESPGLAARRAASGKLPNKALVSLQQMRFESHDAGMGLGVGPGSAGFEGMEGVSPGPGMTFRLALGLTEKDKDRTPGSEPGTPGEEENTFSFGSTTASSTSLGAPSLLRHGSSSLTTRRRQQFPRSPGSSPSVEPIRIPPSLRGHKVLDKLNLSPTGSLTSPRDRLSFSPGYSLPSPLMQRTSAFAYANTGPLTPLTPSNIPGAPDLSSSGGFDWSCSLPDSPSTPCSIPAPFTPTRSFLDPYYLPTPPSETGRCKPNAAMRSQSAMSPISPTKSETPVGFFGLR